MYRFRLGISTAEFLAAVSLIGVCCIGALTLFRGSVQEGFYTISQGIPSQTAINAKDNMDIAIINSASSHGILDNMGNTTRKPNNIDLATLNTSDISASIETSGANGTTGLLLSQFDIAINQLLAENAITPDEASNLRQLSNLGHKMGDIEALIEQQFAINGNNPSAFKNTVFAYDGKQYTFSQLVGEIQLVPNSNGLQPKTVGSTISRFFEMQKNAVDMLKNPNAKALLGSLSTQIMAIADATEGAANDTRIGFTTTEFRNLLTSYSERVDPSNGKYVSLAGESTHHNASAICELNKNNNGNSKNCEND